MNRINRISAILIKLQSQRVVRAQDIADQFDISLRTVYRDIRTLEEAGIPILSEAGVGYSIMKGYYLPPVMFSHDEAVALLTAQKFVEKMADSSVNNAYTTAMTKIKAILKLTEKDSLENLDSRIEVLQSRLNGGAENEDNEIYQSLISAISDNRIVSLGYQAANREEVTRREIEPLGVFFVDDRWYCIAFCRLRRDYRNFRLDRIKTIAETDQQFTANHPTLKEYLQRITTDKQLQKVVVQFDNQVLRYTDRQKYYFGFVEARRQKNKTEMTFLTNHTDAMAHWLLMFTDQAKVISPDSLEDQIRRLVDDLANIYR